jgi:excisionase family DNA binding protein
MATVIEGKTWYNTSEACKLAGISKPTFLRWVRQKKITDVRRRDRNDWRLFTPSDVYRLKKQVNHIKLLDPIKTSSSHSPDA